MKPETIIILTLTALVIIMSAAIMQDSMAKNTGYTVKLARGWNTIVIPADAKPINASDFYPASVKGDIVETITWDAASQDWAYYDTDPSHNCTLYFFTIEPGRAYMIESNGDVSFTVRK